MTFFLPPVRSLKGKSADAPCSRYGAAQAAPNQQANKASILKENCISLLLRRQRKLIIDEFSTNFPLVSKAKCDYGHNNLPLLYHSAVILSISISSPKLQLTTNCVGSVQLDQETEKESIAL
jgi:hypothetical protein